ncbi:DIS3-like exonuclease 1 [Geodia barretti]|nr:DIS3-like exonuclease 1 [Geodia barretti]
MARNRAIHNDRVAILLLPKSEASNVGDHGEGEGGSVALGAVVGVLERERRKYVATFEEKAEESRGKTERVLVLPYDTRIPKIRIGTRQADLLRSHRIVVQIDTWSSASQYPDGHFVRNIGPIGDVETETAVIMIEHGLSFPTFSRDLLNELPERERWEVEVEEEEKRRDLRETHLVFSIDPQGCEDVDDTLSVRHLKKGVTELGVHIADVSHFVRPGSLTDAEAQRRSTSVYLADRRHDMLPPVLSAHLCSLLSGVDRYAVSVVWKMDQNYDVKSVWFGRTLIRSRYKLSYEVAQQLCDGAAASDIRGDIPELLNLDLSQQELEKRLEELRGAVKTLSEIAHCLKQRRGEDGAVYLDSFEVKVVMGEEKGTANIEDLVPKQHLDVHDTIAECMIFANHWVAKKIHSSLPTSSLLRRHPPPSQTRFTHLRTCAGVRGFQILTGSNKELAESLDNAVDPHDPEVNKIFRILATQAMSQAEYFSTGSVSSYHSTGSSVHSTGSSFHSTGSPDQFSHYGLALDYYTHFTSPIRRYADVIVHRQLLAVVEEEKRGEREREKLPGNVQLAEYCQHMNSTHRAAQLAQMASTEMFQALYFSNHEREDERCVCVGVVYAILTKGVRVQIPRYGVKGVVYLEDKAGLVAQPAAVSEAGHCSVAFASGHLKVEETRVTVTHPAGQYTLTLLDHVTVRVGVEVSHAHGPSIRLYLMSCCTVDPRERRSPLFTSDRGRKEVLAGVRDDLQSKPVEAPSLSSSSSFSQTPPQSSLYCLVQRLHNLSLQDAD